MTPTSLLHDLMVVCDKLKYGCGNGGCRISLPKGQHTNATCQCTPTAFSKRLLTLAAESEKQGREWEKSCTHEPSEPIAAFCFTCKHCGEEIEGVTCSGCDGDGRSSTGLDCMACNGTGIDHWEIVK